MLGLPEEESGSPLVSRLTLYDIAQTLRVASDLNHMETRATMKACLTPTQVPLCMRGCDVVVFPAGVLRKPGRTGMTCSTPVP